MSYTCIVLSFLLLAWAVTPLILWFISWIVSHNTRGRVDMKLCSKLIDKLYGGNGERAIIFNYAVPVAIWIFLIILDKNGYILEAGMVLGGFLLLLLPRYFIDLCYSIKYSFKSRKSEEVEELKERVRELEKKG